MKKRLSLLLSPVAAAAKNAFAALLSDSTVKAKREREVERKMQGEREGECAAREYD